jgi:threonine dehydrogenase-like Zn-dependent dehydrogenase
VKALVFERKLARFAAAAVAGRVVPGRGAKHGPLSLKDVEPPALPADGWHRLRPRLSGICGSDLATIDGTSSRYFEPIVSFPFTMGHEVVGDLADGTRAVLIPVLHCATRGIRPACESCAAGRINHCERIAFGHLEPGLQSGFCESTGGGWSLSMVAHESQLLPIPANVTDEQAVLVEPTACAVHAARVAAAVHTDHGGGPIAIIGAGALGVLTLAALRHTCSVEATIVVAAKHPEQRRWAKELGADRIVGPDELARGIRSETASLMIGSYVSGGAPVVVDCVGTSDSLADALRIVAPGGTVLVVGMPGHTQLDLTSLWHRESNLRGCYAYTRPDFDDALALVQAADLGRLVSATYPLDRYTDAIEHAAQAGARGAARVAFDLRNERHRDDY